MRNPRQPHLTRSVTGALIALMLLAPACGSEPDEALATDDIAELSDDVAELSDDVAELSDETESTESDSGASTDEQDAGRDPSSDRPATVQPAAAGLMTATGTEVTILVDGIEHSPFPFPDDGDPPIISSVDGDGADGLVLGFEHTIWWAGVGVSIPIATDLGDTEPRLLDVAETSSGPVALVLWEEAGVQRLGGFPLEDGADPLFLLDASNDAWTTRSAALIGDDTDRILLAGASDGCPGLAALDFAGNAVDLPNVPLLTQSIIDPTIETDVCADGELVAAWNPDGIVVAAETGPNGVTVRAFDTASTSADGWFVEHPLRSGPWSADFLDLDVLADGTTTGLLTERTGGTAVRFNVADLFSLRDPFLVLEGTGGAALTSSAALAPGFNSQLASDLMDNAMMALDETPAPSAEPTCTAPAGSDDVEVDLLGDGTPELWRFTGDAGATGGPSAIIVHGVGDPEACEEIGALVGDEQLVFVSSFSAASPAGWYCRGVGGLEIVQWFGDAGTGAGDATVELRRHTPPDEGIVWSPPVVETLTGLDTPFPPELAESTCPPGLQPGE